MPHSLLHLHPHYSATNDQSSFGHTILSTSSLYAKTSKRSSSSISGGHAILPVNPSQIQPSSTPPTLGAVLVLKSTKRPTSTEMSNGLTVSTKKREQSPINLLPRRDGGAFGTGGVCSLVRRQARALRKEAILRSRRMRSGSSSSLDPSTQAAAWAWLGVSPANAFHQKRTWLTMLLRRRLRYGWYLESHPGVGSRW